MFQTDIRNMVMVWQTAWTFIVEDCIIIIFLLRRIIFFKLNTKPTIIDFFLIRFGEILRSSSIINLESCWLFGEIDAKKVVDYFNKGNNDVSEFEVIVDECRRCCRVYFENSKVEFSPRQTNEVAHTLAREALFLAGPHVFNDVPLCILSLINNKKL